MYEGGYRVDLPDAPFISKDEFEEKYKNNDNSVTDIPKITISKDHLRSSWQRHKKMSSNRAVNRLICSTSLCTISPATLCEDDPKERDFAYRSNKQSLLSLASSTSAS